MSALAGSIPFWRDDWRDLPLPERQAFVDRCYEFLYGTGFVRIATYEGIRHFAGIPAALRQQTDRFGLISPGERFVLEPRAG